MTEMTERKKREKVPNMESLTMGNCTISLTLDTRYRDDNGKYHASIRFTVNGSSHNFVSINLLYVHFAAKLLKVQRKILQQDRKNAVGGESLNKCSGV